MDLENRLVNLELSKKFKMWGIKQDSLWYWYSGNKWKWWYKRKRSWKIVNNNVLEKPAPYHPLFGQYTLKQEGLFVGGAYSAFTLEELKKIVPNNLQKNYRNANSLAKILIHMLEDRLIVVNLRMD